MNALRLFLLAHRRSTVLLCMAALALRVLIPGGYMLAVGPHGVAITLCPGMVAAPAAMAGMDHASGGAMTGMDDAAVQAMTGTHHQGNGGGSKEHGQVEMPCAFSALTTLALGGVDAVLLTAALAFVATLLLLAPPRGMVRQAPYLRPPLRGPPPLPM